MTQPQDRFPARIVSVAVLMAFLGAVVLQTPAGTFPWYAGWVPLLFGLAVSVGFTARWAHRRRGSAGTIGRWSRRSRRNDGVASTWDVLTVASTWAMRRRAGILSPRLAQEGRWRRWRAPVTAYATPVARVGLLRVWSPVEDATLRLGGPRTGKSGEMACRIVDAPGAVVVTSTRTDLLTLTAGLRAKRGPVMIFNPSGLGDIPTTIKFSPLTGCRSPRIATDRAADMIPYSTSAEGERWDAQARRTLALLLHAAALGDKRCHDVLGWVSTPNARAQAEVLELLRESPETDVMSEGAKQFFQNNERTRTSITTTIMPALGWLTDSVAAATAEGADDELFDVEEFLRLRGSLYLLGAEDAIVAPLVAALTAEIARRARWAAGGGRLDPALTLALDEAALICPVPIDRWTADMGGRNITIHVAAQSLAQLRQRWGKDGADTILTNSATLLVFGGARAADDLAALTSLSGERDEVVETRDASGTVTSTTTRRVPVLSPSQLAHLPFGKVMLIRRGMPASIGRVTMAWARPDVRRANKRAPWQPPVATRYEDDAKLAATAEEAPA